MDEGHALDSLVSSSIPLQQPSLQGPVDRLARHRRVVAQVMGPAAAGATGQFVRASDPPGGPLAEDYDDRIYECVTPGTTDAVQPTYDTTIGQDTTDGAACFGLMPRSPGPRRSPRSPVLTDALDAYADSWFDDGLLVWQTGGNAGSAMRSRAGPRRRAR